MLIESKVYHNCDKSLSQNQSLHGELYEEMSV